MYIVKNGEGIEVKGASECPLPLAGSLSEAGNAGPV